MKSEKAVSICGFVYRLNGFFRPFENFFVDSSFSIGDITVFRSRFLISNHNFTIIHRGFFVTVKQIDDGALIFNMYDEEIPVSIKSSADYRHIDIYIGATDNEEYYDYIAAFLLRYVLLCSCSNVGILCIHGAAISLCGSALVFSGDSGIGKSTRAESFVNYYGAEWINGDKPSLKVLDVPMVCGVPWDGKEKIYKNVAFPLKAMLDVRRYNGYAYIRKLTESQAQRILLNQCPFPEWDIDATAATIATIRIASRKLPIYRVFCGPDETAAREIYDILWNHPEKILEAEEEMKIKEGFLLREVMGEFIVMPVGERVSSYGGAIALNEVSAFVFKALARPMAYDDILALILDEYDIDEETAKADLDELLKKFEELDILEK